VDEAANTAQPVNPAVIVDVARLLAGRARAAALYENRRGDFASAAAVLEKAVAALRVLAARPAVGKV
jgi:hypothetical protein